MTTLGTGTMKTEMLEDLLHIIKVFPGSTSRDIRTASKFDICEKETYRCLCYLEKHGEVVSRKVSNAPKKGLARVWNLSPT